MNCQEALSLLYDVIDKEASAVDMKLVQEHLDRCRDCEGVYKVERSISQLIIERAKNPNPTPHFDALRARVLRQLDQIDSSDC